MGRQKHGCRVGVRELRQNLSVYLRRVKAGESIEVTERGQPVALLRPLIKSESVLDRMIAEGRAIAPTRKFSDLGPPPKLNLPRPLSRILAELREQERF